MIPPRYQPQHNISLAQALIKSSCYRASKYNALKNLDDLNLTETEMEEILLELTKDDFCKSEINGNNEWQDYFKLGRRVKGNNLFIKWKIVNDNQLIIATFKQDTDDFIS